MVVLQPFTAFHSLPQPSTASYSLVQPLLQHELTRSSLLFRDGFVYELEYSNEEGNMFGYGKGTKCRKINKTESLVYVKVNVERVEANVIIIFSVWRDSHVH